MHQNIRQILLFLTICISYTAWTQDSPQNIHSKHSKYRNNSKLKTTPLIQINQNHTTHLVFLDNIIYADIGQNEHYILDYTNNILRLKGIQHAASTNLTVVTKNTSQHTSQHTNRRTHKRYNFADNFTHNQQYFYSFTVQYTTSAQVNYFIQHEMGTVLPHGQTQNNPLTQSASETANETANKAATKSPAKSFAKPINYRNQPRNQPRNQSKADYIIHKNNHKLFLQAQNIRHKESLYDYIGTRHGGIELAVTAIYHSLYHCFIRYRIRNRSPIPYDIQYLEFGIRQKKRTRKSAIHEQQLKPVLIDSYLNRVLPFQTSEYVAVFNKIAIPHNRTLYLKIVENGRNLDLTIPYTRIPIGRL